MLSHQEIEELYRQNWMFVLQVLPTFGVFGTDQEDVAQTVFQSVFAQRESFDPARQTPRAWLTGFVRRCAANYRRTRRRRPEVPVADAGWMAQASALTPEQMALLRALEQAVPDELDRAAFLLQARHGYTLEEIAATLGLKKPQVEWRLERARRQLAAE